MNSKGLYDIIRETTTVFRKGERVKTQQVGNVQVIEVFGYAHTSEAETGDNFDKVDMIFVDVLVNRAVAEKYKTDLTRILQKYPSPKRLAEGPSYIELAPALGIEQEETLRLMALGQALGMWKVVSGKTLKLNDKMTRQLAGSGILMITGYSPPK